MHFDFIIDLTKLMDHQKVNNTPSYILLRDILTWLGIDSCILKGINSLNLVAKGTIPEYILKAGIESMFYKLHSAIQDSYSTNLVWLHLKEILNEKTQFIIKHLDQEIQFFHYNPNGCLIEDSPSAKSGITAFYLSLQKSSFKNDVIPTIIDLNHTDNFVQLKELRKIILDTVLNTEHLVQEWKIWSKCFGKVIIINGASCCGKSTLVSYLKKSGFYGITIDDVYDQHYLNYLKSIIQDKIDPVEKLLPREDFWKVLLNFKIDSSQYEEYQRNYIKALADYLRDNSDNIKEHCPESIEIYKIIYSQASTFIFSGINVVVDLIMHDNEISAFSSAFNYYPICTYLLYSPLKDNLLQCFWRNYCCFKKTETLKDINFDPRTSSYVLKKYTELYEYSDKPASVRLKFNLENTQSCEELKDIFNYAILDTYNIYYSLYRDCDSNSLLKEVKQIKQYYSTVANSKAYIIPTFKTST